jgi:endogenous inhibitor of DNA gyrase (YacG/DUF329 family)
MDTMIPPTELSRILQTNSSPETIVALLNEAEEKHSPTPKHCNAKRVYPFWKTCKVCSKPFMTFNPTQALRNVICSKECFARRIREAHKGNGKPPAQRAGMVKLTCPICGKTFFRAKSHAERTKESFCSQQCAGRRRGQEWAKHGHKGRAGWTEQSKAAAIEKMTGPNNPAWKGGVTYFRKHGNYPPIKYVRCPSKFLAMARKDGYVMEHRLIVAQHLGRPLKRSEVVHHFDHDPTNNDPKNLALFKSNQHHKLYEANGLPAPLWQL